MRAIAVVLALLAATPAQAARFRFVSWGDSRLDGAPVLAAESRQAAALAPAFTLFAGDLETSGFTPDGMATWWRAVNGDTTGASSNGLGAVTFPVRGNHDAVTAEAAADWQARFDLAGVASRIGATHYTALEVDLTWSFDYQNAHFVGLDAPGDFASTVTPAQLAWLDRDLTAAEARGITHAFLVWHGPLLTCTPHHRVDPGDPANRALVDVVNRHPIVSAIFVGHEHVTAHVHVTAQRIPNVTHEFEQFTHGGGGARPYGCDAPPPNRQHEGHAFAVVDVVDATFTVSWYAVGVTSPVATFTFGKEPAPPRPGSSDPAPATQERRSADTAPRPHAQSSAARSGRSASA